MQGLVVEHVNGQGAGRILASHQCNLHFGQGWEAIAGVENLQATYQAGGHSQFTYDEFLRPLQGLIHWIGAEFIPYYIVDNTHRMTDDELEEHANAYRQHLQQLTAA